MVVGEDLPGGRSILAGIEMGRDPDVQLFGMTRALTGRSIGVDDLPGARERTADETEHQGKTQTAQLAWRRPGVPPTPAQTGNACW